MYSKAKTASSLDVIDATPDELVLKILGSGVSYSNVVYKGANTMSGVFSNGISSGINVDKGIILSTGLAKNAMGTNDMTNTTQNHALPGDIDLTNLAAGITYDANVLEFDFIPVSSKITVKYVLGSEEYMEYYTFGDIFAFIVNGSNIAFIPGTTTPVSVSTVNQITNSQYYIDNPTISPVYNIQCDGFTTVFTATATVNVGVINHFKLAVADKVDGGFDTWVFIEGESFGVNTGPIVNTTAVTDITPATFIANGEITSLSDENPTQHGFVWSTTNNPEITLSTKTEQGMASSTGPFFSTINGLLANTTYFVRAYATTTKGTVYGNQVSFTTGKNKVWTGSIDYYWDNAGNWSTNNAPTSIDDVVIPNVSRKPVIKALTKAEINNLTIESGATVTLESTNSSTGQLKVNGTTTNAGQVILMKSFSVTKGWYFLSLPFEVKAENIKFVNAVGVLEVKSFTGQNKISSNTNALVPASWGDPFGEEYSVGKNFYLAEYDGAARAAAGVNYTANSPYWINVTDKTKLTANKGYIMIVEKDITLFFISDAGITNSFSTTDLSSTVRVDGGSSSFNNSWNLSGMPYLSGFNMNKLNQANFCYFYNQATATYDVMEKNGSNYVMYPFGSFFFQADNTILTFADAGKALKAKSTGTTTNADYTEAALQISNGTYSDLTRIRLQEGANPEYVINEDAAKFFSLNNEIPQLWTSAEGCAVSVNELPAETQETGLFVKTMIPGYYTIGLASRPTNSTPSTLLLFDKSEGKTADLLSGNYTYFAYAGTNTDRFKILFAPGVTTKTDQLNGWQINAHNLSFSINGLESNNQVKVYDSKGILVQLTENGQDGQIVRVPMHGVYIIQIRSGAKSEKIKLIL